MINALVVPCLILPDPFADAAKGDEEGVQDGLVHIRIQQRNGRKTLTTIQGLSKEYDLKKIVRSCKKVMFAQANWVLRLGGLFEKMWPWVFKIPLARILGLNLLFCA